MKDLPCIDHWDDQKMLKLHRLIMDKLGGYAKDNVSVHVAVVSLLSFLFIGCLDLE